MVLSIIWLTAKAIEVQLDEEGKAEAKSVKRNLASSDVSDSMDIPQLKRLKIVRK